MTLNMNKKPQRVSNPDELNKHLQRTSPMTWVVLSLCLVGLVAFFVWSLAFPFAVTVEGTAAITQNEAVLQVAQGDKRKVKEGQKVHILDQVGTLYVTEGTYIVKGISLDDGKYPYAIDAEMRPIDFLLGR